MNFSSTHVCYIPCPSQPPLFDHTNKYSVSSSYHEALHYAVSLDARYFPSHHQASSSASDSRTSSAYVVILVYKAVLHAHKTSKTIFLQDHILVFILSASTWEGQKILDRMVTGIPEIWFPFNFFIHAVLNCWCRSPKFEHCHIRNVFITYSQVVILSCFLLTRHEHPPIGHTALYPKRHFLS